VHKITARLTHVAENETREERKPFKVLQLLSPADGFIHCIDGEIVTIGKASMDGRECQTIRLLSNGEKFMKTEKLVDFDMDRKWKSGSVSVFAKPLIKQRDGNPVLMFEVCENQESPEQKIEGDVFLCPVRDWDSRDWKPGKVTIAVRNRPFISRFGNRGVNYTASENQG